MVTRVYETAAVATRTNTHTPGTTVSVAVTDDVVEVMTEAGESYAYPEHSVRFIRVHLSKINVPPAGPTASAEIQWADIAPDEATPAAILDTEQSHVSLLDGGWVRVMKGLDSEGEHGHVFDVPPMRYNQIVWRGESE